VPALSAGARTNRGPQLLRARHGTVIATQLLGMTLTQSRADVSCCTYFRREPIYVDTSTRKWCAWLLPSAQDRGDDRLRLCSASSSRRYSIPAGVKAMVCWSSAPWIQRQPSSGSISSARSHRRQELLVLAEHFGGAADGESESRRRHVRRRGRQASRGANSTAAVRPIR
jgi:hypothetical protein